MAIFVAGVGLLGVLLLIAWGRADGPGPHDLLDTLFPAAASLVLLLGWTAVILASAGRFSLAAAGLVCLVVAAGVGALLAIRRVEDDADVAARRREAAHRRSGGVHEAALAFLLVACAVVYLRPHEWVLGGADAGTYVNIGATIARSGRLVLHDPWVGLLAEHGDAALRATPPGEIPRWNQFVGWFVDDADPARVIPQFFPLHPALLAYGIAFHGLRAGLLIPPVVALLGLVAVYLVGRRLFGRPIGLLGTALLAATPTEIYFSRYPTAEPLALLLVFTGLYAFDRLREQGGRSIPLGLLGGASIGAALLTRIDLPVVAVLFAVAVALEIRRAGWTPGWLAFAAALGGLIAHVAIHSWWFAWPYVWNVYRGPVQGLIRCAMSPLGIVAAVAAVAGAAALAVHRPLRESAPVRALRDLAAGRAPLPDGARMVLATSVVAASAWAYFLRPLVTPERTSITWPSGNPVPFLDALNWVRLGWYLTPLGLALATAGAAVTLARARLDRVGLLLAVGGSAVALYTWRMMNTPYHIYTMRRFVPIAIPILMLLAAVAIGAVRGTRRAPWRRGIAAVLAGGLFAGLLFQSRFVLPQRDFLGAPDWIATLESRLRPGSVVLFSEPPGALVTDTFGPPLRFAYDHPIVPVRRGESERVRPLVDAVLARAAAEGRPVQLLAVTPVAPALREYVRLSPVGTVPVAVPNLRNTYDSFPSVVETASWGLEIYDVLPGAEKAGDSTVTIDVGTMDGTALRTGFHDKEAVAGAPSGRWTGAIATVDLPRAEPGPVSIAIRARVYPGNPTPTVRVLLDDRPIGEFRVEPEWRTFEFDAQALPLRGRSRLEFETPTFRPAEGGASTDTRDLGVFLDWIEMKSR